MNDSELIDAMGGTGRVAALCEIKPPSVSGWRKLGIPPARRQFLRLMFPAVFRKAERRTPRKRKPATRRR